jgi:hypothetical protein
MSKEICLTESNRTCFSGFLVLFGNYFATRLLQTFGSIPGNEFFGEFARPRAVHNFVINPSGNEDRL